MGDEQRREINRSIVEAVTRLEGTPFDDLVFRLVQTMVPEAVDHNVAWQAIVAGQVYKVTVSVEREEA